MTDCWFVQFNTKCYFLFLPYLLNIFVTAEKIVFLFFFFLKILFFLFSAIYTTDKYDMKPNDV